MSKSPVVYKSTHIVKFSELDPYNHMRTAVYAGYYVDHRMDCLRENVGWNLKALSKLTFMIWVRRIEIDYIRPVVGDQEITITSFVREFKGSNAYIECSMVDKGGNIVSRCLLVVAYVDKTSNQAIDWPEDVMALFYEDANG